ncbi:MAG: hypothetical protein KF900_00085 [Bacteroidetes bacterium]|nr:hypothetical protein [Bacteroidota bacterium]
MQKFSFLILGFAFLVKGFSQTVKPCDKEVLNKTYTYANIDGILRNIISKVPQEKLFGDDYFNNLLKTIVDDRKLSEKEKVQLFYLMQKKIGFAFSGVAFIPPKQNYFMNHSGRVYTFQKTHAVLTTINAKAQVYLDIAETQRSSDALLAGNALLLATLISPETSAKKLRTYTKETVIKQSKNANVFNHYVCMSASLVQDSVIVKNLIANLEKSASAEMKEDWLCALYSKINPLITLQKYILGEKDKRNALAIQTALCIIYDKVPETSYATSLKSILNAIPEKEEWKQELLKNVWSKKYPYNYSLANNEKLISKIWEGVSVQQCSEGYLITNGALTEIDED